MPLQIELITKQQDLKTLCIIANENRNERNHYVAPFTEYQKRIYKIWSNKNNRFLLFTDMKHNFEAVGYAIITTNELQNALVVFDIYVMKHARNKSQAFQLLFNYLYDEGKERCYRNIRWDSKLKPELWNKILKCNPDGIDYLYSIDIDVWRENNPVRSN